MTSCNRCHTHKPSLIIAAVVAATALVGVAHAQNVSFGQRLFQDKGDCKFCHGENGDGRGDPRSPLAGVAVRALRTFRPLGCIVGHLVYGGIVFNFSGRLLCRVLAAH